MVDVVVDVVVLVEVDGVDVSQGGMSVVGTVIGGNQSSGIVMVGNAGRVRSGSGMSQQSAHYATFYVCISRRCD